MIPVKKIHKIIENEEKYDIFIDFLGSKYEWCNILVEKIVEKLKQYNIKYCISDRYSSDYNIEKELINLKNSRLYLTCYDENEPDLDSSILQGFAYYNNLDIIGYESNPVIYYVEGKQEFGVSLMLEQSCNEITNNIDVTIKKILDYYK